MVRSSDCYVSLKKTFWVRVIFVFTNVNIQHGILLLIQSIETNMHDSDDGEVFKQVPIVMVLLGQAITSCSEFSYSVNK